MPRRKGFTLVELLVVIGIIALLIGILLPTLGRAREAAKTLVCASDGRQISLGLRLFTQEHRGYLPAGSDKAWAYQSDPTRQIWVYRSFAPGQAPVLLDWASSLLRYMSTKNIEWFPDAPQYGSKVFLCPSDEASNYPGPYGSPSAAGLPTGAGLLIFNNMPDPYAGWPLSYGINLDIVGNIDYGSTPKQGRFGLSDNMSVYGGPTDGNGPGLPLNGKFDRVRKPSEVLLLADCGVRYNTAPPNTPLDRNDVLVYTTNYMYAAAPTVTPAEMGKLSGVAKTSWLGGRIPWRRHRNKINVIFCDGHGEVIQKNTDENRVRISPY